MSKVNLADKFRKFEDLWSPKLVGELNENWTGTRTKMRTNFFSLSVVISISTCGTK